MSENIGGQTIGFTPLELLLICRFNQLRKAAAEFFDADKAHGGFWHPEVATRKRRAAQQLGEILAAVPDAPGPRWNEKFNGETIVRINDENTVWTNAGPAA
jgi:hypothetical protein